MTEGKIGNGSCYSSPCRRAGPIRQFPLSRARARVPRPPLGKVTVEEGGLKGTVEVFNSKTCGSVSGLYSPGGTMEEDGHRLCVIVNVVPHL